MEKFLTAKDVIDNDKYMQEKWEEAIKNSAKHLYPVLEGMADILYKAINRGNK